MKVIIHCLILLAIPLMLSSLASADTIIFKDGMIVYDIGRTWRNDGQVKWATSGITIGYPEEDVERVEKTPIEEDPIDTQPIKKKRIKKGIKFSKHQTQKTTIQNPPYFGMDKSQYNLCIGLGKTVMIAQATKSGSPQHNAAYKEWNENCGISVFIKLSEKYPQLSHVPASPLDWANLKSYRVPQQTRKTPIEEDSIGTQPIANKNIEKQTKPSEQTISKSELQSNGVRIGEGLVCDKFKLVTKVTGSTLDLSVDTDLPDNTVVMVSVSRSFLEKVNKTKYSVDYFSEKSTIGKWKSKHRISVDSEKWKSGLRKQQELMSGLELGSDVASISEKITVRMVVPINQPDPRFGKRNSKLTGKAVRATGLRVVEDEIEIDYPLDLALVGKSPFPNLNPLELEVGQTYFVSKKTPLMPSHSPADPMAALQKMKYITAGGGFRVLDTFDKNGNPWYRVRVFDLRKKQFVRGWINSAALLGQQLKANK